jgi:competence protein ComEC
MNVKSKIFLRAAIGLLVFSAVLILVLSTNQQAGLRVVYLDVGQGDAIYISAPHGFDIIIDGGPDDRVVNQLGKYLPFYDRTIELVILSHPHTDHLTGLVELFERYEVERVLHSPVAYDIPAWEILQESFDTAGAAIDIARTGQQYHIGDDLKIEVLHPSGNSDFSDINEMSVVVRLDYGDTSFLFTGDIGEIVEQQLISSGMDINADVLKVGHHGSKYSSSAAFLKLIKPQYAVIQSGVDNSFDHPHEETIERLQSQKIETLRNDLQGDIICRSDKTIVVCD